MKRWRERQEENCDSNLRVAAIIADRTVTELEDRIAQENKMQTQDRKAAADDMMMAQINASLKDREERRFAEMRGERAPYLAPFLHHDVLLQPGCRVPGYAALEEALCAAYAQASAGKGAQRHSSGEPFEEQPILGIARLLGDASGPAFQAIKKLREGLSMAERGQHEAGIREFLGAINYIAAVALLVAEDLQHMRDMNAE